MLSAAIIYHHDNTGSLLHRTLTLSESTIPLILHENVHDIDQPKLRLTAQERFYINRRFIVNQWRQNEYSAILKFMWGYDDFLEYQASDQKLVYAHRPHVFLQEEQAANLWDPLSWPHIVCITNTLEEINTLNQPYLHNDSGNLGWAVVQGYMQEAMAQVRNLYKDKVIEVPFSHLFDKNLFIQQVKRIDTALKLDLNYQLVDELWTNWHNDTQSEQNNQLEMKNLKKPNRIGHEYGDPAKPAWIWSTWGSDSEYKQQVLDNLSASFCGAKWYNATIWLGSGMTTSCHHPPAHLVDSDKVTSNPRLLHNTDQKKADRAMMQAGERPPGCEYCWKIEDMERDAVSDRVYKSKIYAPEDLIAAKNLPADEDVNLKTLEIAFDRTCQFACSYCNPAFSTTWVKDIRNGPYENLISDGRNHFTHKHDSAQLYKITESNPYVDAFFDWWETDLHKTLSELRITGGEPLMSGHTWKLIDWFKNNPGRTKTSLAINSNLGFEQEKLEQLLESTEGLELDIYTSNESIGSQAEYIRDGLDWEQWLGNLQYLIESKKVRALHVMNTINALCLETLPEFLDVMLDYKNRYGADFPNFTLNILRFPSFQSPLVLPDDIRMHHCDRLQAWLDTNGHNANIQNHERNHLKRLIDYLDVVKTPHSDSFEMPRLHNDFKQFYSQYDQRRNKNFTKTFPSLAEWYNGL